ncbi:MAG: putative lipid II flippase FtsW [Gammaproteobacteria bacterium]|nr:putative lipid II flippase FtsW [Gammaproteobacteria bacterium]
MTIEAAHTSSYTHGQAKSVAESRFDMPLLVALLFLLGLGMVMVASASIDMADRRLGQPLYYLIRQSIFVGIGLSVAWAILRLDLNFWKRSGAGLLVVGFVLLVLVLIVGREVNGSIRWLSVGPFNVQVSELFKLFMILYLAGYMERRLDEVRSTASGFLKPMAVLGLAAFLLLLEPDFGAAAVLGATVLGMLFLAGVRLRLFGLLVLVVAALVAALVASAPYRMQRLTAFMDPWADPFNSGFQLTQALIAIGQGEWLGSGLGGSIQKLFYLPEAHTDFLFAVMAEEFGLVGSVALILVFAYVTWRVFCIGKRANEAGKLFEAYLTYGIGLWFGLQAFINIGVNMGVLPTKGLTLPLMSYGGSSIVVMCMAMALVLRVDFETRFPRQAKMGEKPSW